MHRVIEETQFTQLTNRGKGVTLDGENTGHLFLICIQLSPAGLEALYSLVGVVDQAGHESQLDLDSRCDKHSTRNSVV